MKSEDCETHEAPPPAPGWMPSPVQVATPANCPPGLEYLVSLDQVLVHQVVEMLEAFTGFETENKYAIKNVMGQQCYYAFEESGCCGRQCCGSQRSFVIKIVDNSQREVIRITRDFNCCATTCCWLPCCGLCRHEIVVESPPGLILGKIHNSCSFWKPFFTVEMSRNNDGSEVEAIATITGPCCINRMCCYCCDVVFDINSVPADKKIGKLKKQSTGFVKEAFTDADHFSITFPRDLDVRAKALLLSAVFLIDFLYYEDSPTEVKSS